jgi:hypothetical protein
MVASLRGSVSTGTKEVKSNTGRFWAAGFHHITARSELAHFENYEPFISVDFLFFSGCGKTLLTETEDTESAVTGVRFYFECCKE